MQPTAAPHPPAHHDTHRAAWAAHAPPPPRSAPPPEAPPPPAAAPYIVHLAAPRRTQSILVPFPSRARPLNLGRGRPPRVHPLTADRRAHAGASMAAASERFVYALVAHRGVVLAEGANRLLQGDFARIAYKLLNQVPHYEDKRVSYASGRHTFHVMTRAEMIYLCLAQSTTKKKMCYDFLDELRRAFYERFGDVGGVPVPHHAMQDDFTHTVQAMIERYCATGDANVDKVERMQHALDDVQGLVMQGIDKALKRGADLESLVHKSDELSRSSVKFETVSRKFARDGFAKDVRAALGVCGVLVLVFYALVAHACGGFSMPTCD